MLSPRGHRVGLHADRTVRGKHAECLAPGKAAAPGISRIVALAWGDAGAKVAFTCANSAVVGC